MKNATLASFALVATLGAQPFYLPMLIASILFQRCFLRGIPHCHFATVMNLLIKMVSLMMRMPPP